MPQETANTESPLSARIEAVLYWRGEPSTTKELSKLLSAKEAEIGPALDELSASLSRRGIALVRTDDTVALGTAPEMAGLIEKLAKEELSRDLGKAGLETLSIILYKGPVSRREIDYIRGVNSTFIIRNLMIRGLIERLEEGKDGRSFRYRATIDLLSFLGVRRIEDLPEYAAMRAELDAFEREKGAQEEPKEAAASKTEEASRELHAEAEEVGQISKPAASEETMENGAEAATEPASEETAPDNGNLEL